jgi:hypothetical protein
MMPTESISIRNDFDESSGVELKVLDRQNNSHSIGPNSIEPIDMDFSPDNPMVLSIDPGYVPAPNTKYPINVGSRIVNLPNTELGDPLPGSFIEKRIEEKTYYLGGLWEIDQDKNEWELYIYGPNPDKRLTGPVEADIIVGPGTPG